MVVASGYFSGKSSPDAKAMDSSRLMTQNPFEIGCNMRCVVKNTFLELVDGHQKRSQNHGARKRASSDGHFSDKFFHSRCKDDIDALSTEGSDRLETDDGSSCSLTPRNLTKDSFNTTELTSPSGPSHTPSFSNDATRITDWSDLTDDSFEPSHSPSFSNDAVRITDWSVLNDAVTIDDVETPPGEILQMLEEFQQLAGERNFKREDLIDHEVSQRLYPYIPLDDQGNLTSLGSIAHFDGSCKPCAFLKKDRCHKKDVCLYCHFDHDVSIPKTQRTRKSKKKRMRIKEQHISKEPEDLKPRRGLYNADNLMPASPTYNVPDEFTPSEWSQLSRYNVPDEFTQREWFNMHLSV
jgi:hypothetical protein